MEPVRIEFLMVDKLSGRLAQATGRMEQMTGKTAEAKKQMQELDKSGLSLQKTIGRLATAFTIKELVSNITKVRGEFQQLEVAFETMLGNAEKARTLMAQLTQTAATTPFGLEDVAQGAKQLLAYGLEAEKVNETLIRLGDIAAGLSVPLNDLVYLYGTTMAQGRLYTQDLNQFTGRGIPMIGELAKQFGVAESKVKDLVEAGKVGFPEVQKVIESLTDDGGKFGGLMEAQSKTITGQISNIEDAISMMLNEIGQQNEGIINTTLSGVSHVIENYERFGRILLGLVATYGVYKTAIMTVTAAKGWATAAEALHYNWLLLVEKAQKMLNATMLANPYVLVATLIAGVVAAMVSMKTEAERLKEADEAYEAQKQKVIEAEEEHRRKIDELCSIAGDEAVSTDTRREALNRLEQKYPDIFAKYDTEYEKLKNIKKIKEEIALLDGQKSITNPVNELKSVEDRIKELEAKKATERYVTMQSSAGAYTTKVGGLSSKEEAELKNLLGKRNTLSTQIRKNKVNAYFENLTGVSNETLARQIKQRETLLAQMTMQEKKYGRITQGNAALTGNYSRDELQYQLNKLRSEQNRRNKPVDSSSDWAASAKKKYQKALKAYNDFIKDTSNNLTQEEFEKKAKELKDAVDAAKKDYDKVKPGRDSDSETERKNRERAEREAEKRRQVSERLGQELAELQRENDASEIEAMDEGLRKKLRQIDNDYQARKNEIDKQESDWKRKNKEAGRSEDLSEEQQSAIDNANELNDAKRQRAVAEAYGEELASMREYLKEYGSFEQRKLAITEEYAEKIRKAGSEGERLSLEKEKKKALSVLSFESISAGIDWKALFSGVGALSKEMLSPMLEQLQAYARTDEYKESDAQTQQQVAELIQEIRKYTGTDRSMTWEALAAAMTDFTTSVDAYNKAVVAEKEAVTEREEAKKRLDAGEITEAEYRQAADNARLMGDATAKAREDMEGFGATLNDTSEQVANFTSGLTAALNNAKAWQGVDGFSGMQQAVSGIDAFKGALDSALPTMGDGMAKTLASGLSSTLGDGLSSLGKGLGGILTSGIGQVVGFAAQVPRLILDLVSGIKGFVTGILDSFTELISLRWIDDLVVSILDAVGNLVNAIFDLPENLYKVLEGIVWDGVGGLLDSVVGRVGNILSFGALGSSMSGWFTNSNAKEVQETIDRLTERNELLQTAIEDLTEEMENARGAEAIRISRDAVKLQEETNANYLGMAQAQAGYHGSHHSWNYYWGGFTQDEIARLSGQIGRQWDGRLWSLSPEEMKALRSNVDIWERIQGSGKGGYGGRLTDKLDDYIEQAGKLEELTDALYENLTTTTKENVFDDFLDSLYNLADGSEDVFDDIAENWQSMVNRMAVNNLVGAKFQKQLEDWYEDLAKLNESRTNGEISDAEYKRRLDALQREYERYVEQAQGDIESLRDMGIIKETGSEENGTSQSAKAGGFAAMTQDQGTKLEGMFTSGLQHWSSMDAKMEDVAGKMNSAENHLAKIEENTGKSAAHLNDIKEDIKKMIRDGLKVK